MRNIGKAIIAGFVATTIFSVLMVTCAFVGLSPQFNVIAMLARIIHTTPSPTLVAHFVIGSVLWGGLFALAAGFLPTGSFIVKGLCFGVLMWLAMMIVFMPAAGGGFFATSLGTPVAEVTFGLNLVYGLVIGAVCRLLGATASP